MEAEALYNWDELIRLNLATLNDIVTEMARQHFTDPDLIRLVTDTLDSFTHRLGYLTAQEERNMV